MTFTDITRQHTSELILDGFVARDGARVAQREGVRARLEHHRRPEVQRARLALDRRVLRAVERGETFTKLFGTLTFLAVSTLLRWLPALVYTTTYTLYCIHGKKSVEEGKL